MKECKQILNLIPLYIDNVLSEEETDKVSRHLDSCRKCQDEFKFLNSIMKSTKDVKEIDLPDDFHKNLMEKVKSCNSKKKKRYLTIKRIGAYAAAAAVIAISFVTFSEFIKPQDDQTFDKYITSKVSPEPYNYTEKTDTSKSMDAKKSSEALYDLAKPSAPKEEALEQDDHFDAAAEEKERSEIPASISVIGEEATFTIATVEITEENEEKVLEILSQYEKDDNGYIVSDIETVVYKIKSLGATVNINNDSAITQDYIVIK